MFGCTHFPLLLCKTRFELHTTTHGKMLTVSIVFHLCSKEISQTEMTTVTVCHRRRRHHSPRFLPRWKFMSTLVVCTMHLLPPLIYHTWTMGGFCTTESLSHSHSLSLCQLSQMLFSLLLFADRKTNQRRWWCWKKNPLKKSQNYCLLRNHIAYDKLVF